MGCMGARSPRFLDTCHAFASDGVIVLIYVDFANEVWACFVQGQVWWMA